LTNWFPDAVTFEPRAGGKFRFSFSRTQLGVVEKGMVIRLTKEKFLNLYQTKNLFIPGNGMVLQTFLRLLWHGNWNKWAQIKRGWNWLIRDLQEWNQATKVSKTTTRDGLCILTC